VSHVGTRGGESFTSPAVQRERIEAECEREGLELLEVFEELDVSGGKTLDKRPGLSAAVSMVENGAAEVIVAAYFDRLVRSLSTQTELLSRVEAAGGKVRAVDAGAISAGTSGEWLDSTMRGMMAEYQRRQAGERSREADLAAIDRGVAPWPIPPTGYLRPRTDDGSALPYVIDESVAPALRAAFALRATGATIMRVRDQLKADGVTLTHKGVGNLLSNRAYLGELHWGKEHRNLRAWPAIIEVDVFERCQAKKLAPRGRQTPSGRLLARLGVLRCASCKGRMTVGRSGHPGGTLSWNYRCPTLDCEARAAIKAEWAEELVVRQVRRTLADVQGRASIEADHRAAELEAETAQAALDDTVATFTAAGVGAEPSAVAKLSALREARDAARDRLAQLGQVSGATLTRAADRDWDELSIEEQRALIVATVMTAMVFPGRGPNRMVLGLYGAEDEHERILSGAARRALAE